MDADPLIHDHIHPELHLRKKIPVGILGATGSVGQKFVEGLLNHPWFDIVALAASKNSENKTYREATRWLMASSLPEKIANMRLEPCEPNLPCRIVFSALDAQVALEIEEAFAQKGYIVVSNASAHRMREDVPLLIPEVNPHHLSLIRKQPYQGGAVVTNPNCSAVGLSLAIKPIYERFGINHLHVTTLQAISGAGYPGLSSLDILDNVIPFISGEEDKLEEEPLKILGTESNGQLTFADFTISAMCNRVPVLDGHTECVSIKLQTKASLEDIKECWKTFSVGESKGLPTAPNQLLCYFDEDSLPQPRFQRNLEKGMAVSIGRLRHCPVFDIKFVLLSHNIIRGAAGGAILNAELMVKKGLVYW